MPAAGVGNEPLSCWNRCGGGTEKATASPAAAAPCSGVREETALKAHGQRLPPAGGAGCQPLTFSALSSCYFLVCKGENEDPVVKS